MRARQVVAIGAALGSLAAAPTAPWLPARVEADGYGVVAPALQALDAELPAGRKHDKAVAASGLAELSMPTTLSLGAELVLSDPSPLGGCTWDGSLHCGLSVAAPPGVTAEGFELRCKLGRGPGIPLVAELAAAPPGRIGWTIHRMENCWRLPSDAIGIVPRASADLEGFGQGTELIPPEIIGLSQDQVEATLKERVPGLAVCTRKFSADQRAVAGKMVVAYRIAEDGAMAAATVESSTFHDPQIEGCVVEGFLRLRFPRVNGGFDHGSFPITFVGS